MSSCRTLQPLAFQMCPSSRQALSGPRNTWECLQAKGTARRYQSGPSSYAATASGEDGVSRSVLRGGLGFYLAVPARINAS
jgi:hypothetical protein